LRAKQAQGFKSMIIFEQDHFIPTKPRIPGKIFAWPRLGQIMPECILVVNQLVPQAGDHDLRM